MRGCWHPHLLTRIHFLALNGKQGHTAFDVAPYAVLDRCVLQPWREKVADLEHEHSEATAAIDAAQQELDDANVENERALMVIADNDSRVVEESLLLHAEREVERQWSDRLREVEQALASQRTECEQYQCQLQGEAEELAAVWRDQLQQAQHENADAVELLAQATALVGRTEYELEAMRLMLDHRCGLLQAAREFPNDEDVQSWTMASIRSLGEELVREDDTESSADLVAHDDPLDPLTFLFREESVRVILDAMARFTKTHSIQVQAVQCLVVLVRTSKRLAKDDEAAKATSPRISSRLSALEQFAPLLLRCGTLAALQAALVAYEHDLEIYQLAFELLHHLISCSGATSSVLQFCQSKWSQILPFRFVQLLDRYEAQDNDGDCTTRAGISISASRHHAAHVVFVLTTYNVKKPLLDAGVVGIALSQIDGVLSDTTSSSGRASDDIADKYSHQVHTIRHLLAALAILHSIASPSEQRSTGSDATRTLDDSIEWANFHVQSLVDRLQSFLSRRQHHHTRGIDDVRCWLLNLLRNLVWHRGAVAERIRADMGSLANVQLLADLVCSVDGGSECRDGVTASVGNSTVEAGVELVDVVWIRRYDDEGQLLPTPESVLQLLLQLFEEMARRIEVDCVDDTILHQLRSLVEILAVVATNGTRSRCSVFYCSLS